jgi:hypothetical protein
MSTVITETAANADFATALTRPDSGEDPSVWSLILEQHIQKVADRTQALRILSGANTAGQVERSIQLTNAWIEASAQFESVLSSEHLYWSNTNVSSSIGLHYPLDVPVGLKIVSITARLDGGAFTGNTHAALPATMPALKLLRQVDGVDSTVATQSDTSVNTGAYDVAHSVTLTLNHTILTGNHYFLKVTGEGGANAENSHLVLLGLSMLLAVP